MRHLLALFALFLLTNLTAQRLDHRQGELIVRFSEGGAAGQSSGLKEKPEARYRRAKEWMEARPEITQWKRLGYAFDTYLVTFDHNVWNADVLRAEYWQDDAIAQVQLNHLVGQRARPNDTRYDDQWHHLNVGQINGLLGADHNVEPAWDVTTGGVTANGDTIVVAVVDDGSDLDHEDLAANLWRNHDEIPNNGIDDDNNGYVDDYFGFDTQENDGDPDAPANSNHGTPVAGIIGAAGNNDRGVSGMNWNVKMMSIRNGFQTSESEVLQAYSYALEARQRYDATDGAEGAYVVVTNASWGRDFGQVEDSPIWCGLYDELGEAGIINAGATINRNTNVDEEGDLPTNCTSPFLIGVTNMNNEDEKVRAAGFGSLSIDLGAFGENVFTTGNGNNYEYFGGTSGATPMVAGAMALLYAAPCATFAELLEADPTAAALLIREVLLSTTAANESLNGITVTGGRLDVGAAMAELMSRCDDCLAPTSFSVVPAAGSATELVVDWRVISSVDRLDLRYRPAGTTVWLSVDNVTAPYTLTNLPACSAYEVQLNGSCDDGRQVSTEVLTVVTDGCCQIPEDFTVTAFPGEVFIASWTELLAARSYRVRYRKVGEENWLNRTVVNQGQLGIGGIDSCTDYEFEFQTNCDTLVTDFGARLVVLSTGCGACLEEDYCIPDDFDNDEEHIAEVDLGGIFNRVSGAEPGGYRNVGQLGNGVFVRGGVYRLTLTPDVGGTIDVEGWRVYIDWNQDGVLASGETVAELDNPAGEPAVVDITIPEDAVLGLTRMRVMMQFGGVRGNACGSSALGEVEDYCLDIVEAEGCLPPTSVLATYVEAIDETELRWPASAAPGGSYRLRYRLRDSNDAWVEVDVEEPFAIVRPLNLCATYELELASVCNGTAGDYRLFLFQDDCTDTREQRVGLEEWSVFPNPAYNTTRVRWGQELEAAGIRLFNAAGQLLLEQPTAANFADVYVGGLTPGIYLLELRARDGRSGLRKVVVR